MKQYLQNIHPIFFLIIATTLEVCGDALVRKTIYEYTGAMRIIIAIVAMLLLFGYGFFLNLAPVEFGQVVGLYIATLFVVWQIINYIFFKTLPTAQILVGGSLVVIGGLIITFWKK
jgi:small multidrug resistance family-3 protein